MRFHTLLVLSVAALAAVSAPSVASRHVTVSVDIDVPHHGDSEAPAHLGGASAMSAIPEVPRVERVVGEHERVVGERPTERISGNRQSMNKLRSQILERHNRNTGKEILGGHTELGPDQHATPAEVRRIQEERVLVKAIQKEYERELQVMRDAKVIADREARYAKMSEREAENARMVDELHDVNKVMADEKRIEEDRIKQLQKRVSDADPAKITQNMTPEQIVEAIQLRSLKGMYTDHELRVNEEKKARLESELLNLEGYQKEQRELKDQKDRLQKMIDPIAHIDLQKVISKDGYGREIGHRYCFPEQVEATKNEMGGYKSNEAVPLSEKTEAMSYVARTIQSKENAIQTQRIAGIEFHVKQIEKVMLDNSVKIKAIENPKSEHNQVW